MSDAADKSMLYNDRAVPIATTAAWASRSVQRLEASDKGDKVGDVAVIDDFPKALGRQDLDRVYLAGTPLVGHDDVAARARDL
jgi:hypothetical protein